MRDLDKELSGYVRRRQQGGSASTATAPKSLLEELYDLGEEFVDFLEQGLGELGDEASAHGASKRTYGDLSGRRADDMSTGTGGDDSAATSRNTVTAPGASGCGATAAKSKPAGRKPTTAEYVEEELAVLKRRMGKQ